MIISVQIYNFYLRKGKTREENISFVRNKTTDHSLPTEQMNNKNISKLQFRQYQEIRINKHIFLYYSILLFLLLHNSFLKCNRPLICALNIFYNR